MPSHISISAQIIRWSVLCLLVVGSAVLYVASPALFLQEEGGRELRVTFFDVGQGDAIFIESPTGTQVLIDGGPDASVLRHLSKELDFFDRSLDMVLATHQDSDHIAGLVDVLARYKVAEIVLAENKGESTVAEVFIGGVEAEGAAITHARRGAVFALGGGAVLTILFPDRDPSFLESNTASIIARLTYGGHKFLLTGDAPQAVEEYLVLLDGAALESDVLKVGHHGSRTSTSELFINAVRPQYGIISAGKDNQYGHPHEEVLTTLGTAGADIKNTAEEGSITFVSDGTRLWVEE